MIKIEKFKSDRLIICAQFYDHVITDTPDMDKYGRWKRGLCLYKNKGFVYRGMQNLYAVNNYLKELVNRKNFEFNKNFVGFWMMNNS